MHLAALDQHSGGSKPYQRENRQRGRPVRSLAVTWGRGPAPALGPALGRRVVAVDAEANRFYGQVSILRLMNAVFLWQALGIWRYYDGLTTTITGEEFLVERTRTRKHQV